MKNRSPKEESSGEISICFFTAGYSLSRRLSWLHNDIDQQEKSYHYRAAPMSKQETDSWVLYLASLKSQGNLYYGGLHKEVLRDPDQI